MGNKDRNFKIYGGGLSSMCLAYFLNKHGIRPIIYSEEFNGGLLATRELEQNQFVDTHGSHIVFSRDSQTMNDLAALLPEKLLKDRNTAICTNEGFIQYPYENGIIKQSEDRRLKMYDSILSAPKIDKPTNMKEIFLSVFGEEACNQYYFPYNRKIWKTPVEELSTSIAARIPKPSETYMSNLKAGIFEDGYTHQSKFYISKLGIKSLFDGVNYKALKSKIHYVIDGTSFKRDAVSTIPLDKIGKQLGIDTSSLKKTGLFCKFAKCDKPLPYTWVYDSSTEYPFNRVFSANTDIPIIVFEETTVDGECKMSEQQCENWLEMKFGIKVLEWYSDSYTDYAYPIPTIEAEKELPKIYQEMGCPLFGRWGRWQYLNMDQIYSQAEEFVNDGLVQWYYGLGD